MISDYEDSDDDEQEQPKEKRPSGKAATRNPGAAQSMRQLPVSTPPERTIRKSKSAPMGQINGYPAGNPNYIYPQGAPLSPPPPQPYMYSPPQYNPYAAPNPYYQMQQPTVIIRRNAPVMQQGYGNYDQNFEGYFGPDVRPAHHSALELQREQLQNFERTAPRRHYNHPQHSPAPTSIQSAEEIALEEAIQASLRESNRRPSHGGEGNFGGVGDFDSGYTSLATSSKSHHWNEDVVLGENADPTALADEKALQEAILLSLTDSSSYDEASYSRGTAAPPAHKPASRPDIPHRHSDTDPEPAVPVDRQYPYNLSPELRRESSSHRGESFHAPRSGDKASSYNHDDRAPHFHAKKEVVPAFLPPRAAESFASPRTSESVIVTARTAESAMMSQRTDDEQYERMDPRDRLPRDGMDRKMSPRDEFDQGYPGSAHGGRPVHLLRKDISERTSSTFSSGTTFHPADPRNRSSSTGRSSFAPSTVPLYEDSRGRDPRDFEYPQAGRRSASPQKHHRRHRDFDHYPRDTYGEPYDEAVGYRGAPQRSRPPAPAYDHEPSGSEREGRYRRDSREPYAPHAPHSDPVDRRSRAPRAAYAPEAPPPPQFNSRSSSAPRAGGRDRDLRDARDYDRTPPAKYPQYADRRAVY